MPLSKKRSASLFERIKKAALESILHPGQNVEKLPKKESPKYPEIYMFRHGETYDNRSKIFSGWRDSKITPRGEKQARILAKKLKNKDIDLCITSPLQRSIATARIALKPHKDVLFEIDERIIERSYGDVAGHSKEELMKENAELAIKYRRSYDYPPPHGESIEMVEKRVFPFCEELVERIKKNNINVVISAHNNSMRAIRRYFEKLSIVEEILQENPLGTDYCEYIVKTKKFQKNPVKIVKRRR